MELVEPRLMLSADPAADAAAMNAEFAHHELIIERQVELFQISALAASESGQQDFTRLDDFSVFDSIGMVDRPNLEEFGWKPIQLLTTSFFWGPTDNQSEPNLARIIANTQSLDTNQLAVIDIEHWPTSGDPAVVAESVRKLALVADTMHNVKPDLILGIYRMLPDRDYFTPVLHENNTPEFQAWEAANAQLDELAEHVDVIFPSIYTFYPDYFADGSPRLAERDRWVEYATENLLQARRYGKPVVAFNMPIYHGGGGTTDPSSPDFRYWKFQPISGDFWKLILDTTYQYADSMAIFDSSSLAPFGEPLPRAWNEDLEWWAETQQFLSEILPVSPVLETTLFGIASGGLDAAGTMDGVYEVIEEELFEQSQSRAEHQWRFDLSLEAKTLVVEGFHNSSAETFQFEYSQDGQAWTTTGISLDSQDQNHVHEFDFPAGVSGTVWVRIRDTDRTIGESTADIALIERLAIRPSRPVDLTLPEVSISDAVIAEGMEGTTSANFVVQLSQPATSNVTVAYQTSDGSAQQAEDYQPLDVRTLVFQAGQTQKTISVLVSGDTVKEADETFFVDLSMPVGANIARSRAQGAILNDDFSLIPSIGGAVPATVPVADILTATADQWGSIVASIATGADQDVYSFDLAEDSGVFLDVDAADAGLSGLDSSLVILDADGNIMAENSEGYDFDTFAAPSVGLQDISDTGFLDPSLYLDLPAGSYFVAVDGSGSSTGDYELRLLADVSDTSSVPALDSLPGATDTLYLDFDGHAASDDWGTYSVDAFDFDGNVGRLSPAEKLAILNIWTVMAEDYSPFPINVSTVEPGSFDDGQAHRQVVTGSSPSVFGLPSDAPGATFLNSYNAGGASNNIGFTFASNFSSYIASEEPFSDSAGRIMAAALEQANAASHEFGRALGLHHYATSAGSAGPASVRANGIMATPDDGLNREIWQSGINETGIAQDDVTVISSLANSIGLRDDDHGDSASAATVVGAADNINARGVIATYADHDFFQFTASGDTVVTAAVNDYSNNLDIELRLYDESGAEIGVADPDGLFDASIMTALAAGTYFIGVRSDGEIGELGQYAITIVTEGPIVEFAAATFQDNEDAGTSLVVALNRSGNTTESSIVEVAITGGSAAVGSDFDNTSFPLTVSFEPTESTHIVSIPITEDMLVEPVEDIIFQVVGITNATIGSQSFSILRILDNDTLSFDLAGPSLAAENTTATYTLSLTGTLEAGATASVDIGVTDSDTGTSDYGDFLAALDAAILGTSVTRNGNTLTFDSESPASLNIGLEIVNDAIAEGPEDFLVELRNPASSTAVSTALGTRQVTTTIIDALSTVVSRLVFYNNSAFDVVRDDDAIATDKSALLPGGVADKRHYTTYSRGLNGIIVDIANLPNPAGITSSDFEFHVGNDDFPADWLLAPAPLSITVRPGEGVNGSDRIELIWDDNAIRNQWLEIRILATANTGLMSPDVHYWGHLQGDAGNISLSAVVDFTDLQLIFPNVFTPADVDSAFDIDRSGSIDFTDLQLSFQNIFASLNLITPASTDSAEAEITALAAVMAAPVARQSGPRNGARDPAIPVGENTPNGSPPRPSTHAEVPTHVDPPLGAWDFSAQDVAWDELLNTLAEDCAVGCEPG
jgi:hypothetical protein